MRYDAASIEEKLLNLNENPYETTHFTNDPKNSIIWTTYEMYLITNGFDNYQFMLQTGINDSAYKQN